MTKYKKIIIVLGIIILLGVISLAIPAIRDRVAWRVNNFRIWLHYTLNPPEEVVFVPNTPVPEQAGLSETVAPSATSLSSVTAIIDSSATPTRTVLPTITPSPMPDSNKIEDVPYIDQHGAQNYCGPANLTMQLQYWGWDGTREDIGTYLKPEVLDKNVSPDELAQYVEDETDLKAILRWGGTIDVLKRLIANGYPVLIEKGVYFVEMATGRKGWMGHYNVVIGYDETTQNLIIHDSYIKPGISRQFPYTQITEEWRPFNYVFLVVYPLDQEEKLMSVLGDYADVDASNRIAQLTAENEIDTLEGFDRFYAIFNLGTSQVNLKDYSAASNAYDEAFTNYATLPEEGRPWRMMWYQFGPYIAYYNMERYQDVINLADQTLSTAADPYLGETAYWKFKARHKLGLE